jgi:glycosyltransferase involved in cell wall biosynthesis
MIKVLHIIDSLRGGGKERQLVELLKSLDDSKEIRNEVILLNDINQYPESKTLEHVGIHILKRRIKKDPTVFFKIRKIVKTFNPQIIQSWGSMPSVYTLFSVINSKRKFVNYAIQNGICFKYQSEWLRSKITFPFSDIILANSYAGIEAYPTIPGKSDVIYNGVHLDRFQKIESAGVIRSRFNITTPYIVGMVGAFHPRKDYATFLKAAKTIIHERKDICFLLVGDGGDMEKHKQFVKDLPSENIKFLGRQSDVESIINIFDIGVLTTNISIHREGISNSIIEYMAAGKPVIATQGGGTPEIIDNNSTGYILKPEDVSGLKSKIYHLIENPELRKNFGIRAKEKIENGFSIDMMVRSFCNLYKELASATEN